MKFRDWYSAKRSRFAGLSLLVFLIILALSATFVLSPDTSGISDLAVRIGIYWIALNIVSKCFMVGGIRLRFLNMVSLLLFVLLCIELNTTSPGLEVERPVFQQIVYLGSVATSIIWILLDIAEVYSPKEED